MTLWHFKAYGRQTGSSDYLFMCSNIFHVIENPDNTPENLVYLSVSDQYQKLKMILSIVNYSLIISLTFKIKISTLTELLFFQVKVKINDVYINFVIYVSAVFQNSEL